MSQTPTGRDVSAMLTRIGWGVIVGALWLSTAGCTAGSEAPGDGISGFADSGGTSIRFLIDLPPGDGPFPAVVYGPGSGTVTAKNPHVVAHADRLVELGYAVVRYDKRGTGQSEGRLLNLSTENSARVVPQLAADMKAVLRAAQRHEKIDPQRMALFGASQANWYMPVVAAEVAEVQFMIVLTGGLMPVGPKTHWELLVFHQDRDPFSPETLELWQAYDGPTGFDQRPHLRELGRPMLYLLGGGDPGVPFQFMREELEHLKASGVDITLLSFPQGKHLLKGTDFWDDVRAWLDGL